MSGGTSTAIHFGNIEQIYTKDPTMIVEFIKTDKTALDWSTAIDFHNHERFCGCK